MKRCVVWLIFWGLLGISLLSVAGPLQPKVPRDEATLAAEDKAACIHNLTVIYNAIQAYRTDHKDLPNWLSDLVPYYISDANVLICPACLRTGQAETSALADPRLPSSYYFEFCPVPLDKSATPSDRTRTHREWKRRQMGLVGSTIPMVRCRHHGAVLNLSFDGKIYESPDIWETLLTNQVDMADLSPAKLFAGDGKNSNQNKTPRPPALHFAPRPADAKPGLIDLTACYNAMLTESWHGASGNDLASLPTGLQMLAGTEFDVRGIVQLGSKSDSSKRYPQQIKGIKVRQKCQRLQFLHAAGFGSTVDEGQRIGSYVVHFATNSMQLEIPIYYGRDVRNWHTLAGEKSGAKELTVAWTGANTTSKAANNSIRLYKTTWTNLAPDIEIESIDFVSAMGQPAPFLIAITAE